MANSHLKRVRLVILASIEDDQALIPNAMGLTFAEEFFTCVTLRHLVPKPTLLIIQVYMLDLRALHVFCPSNCANRNYSREPCLQCPQLLHFVEVNFTKTLAPSWVPMCRQGSRLVQLAHKYLTHGS